MAIINQIKYMYVVLLLLILVQNSYSNDFKLISSDENKLIFEYKFDDLKFKQTIINGDFYQIPIVEDAEIVGNVGEPFRQLVNLNINIPSKNGFNFRILDISYEGKNNLKLAPIPQKIYTKDSIQYHYSINDKYFTTEKANLGSEDEFLKIEYKGIAGSKYIAQVSILPYKYDVEISELSVLKSIRIEVDFSSISYAPKIPDNFNYGNAINFNETTNWGVAELFSSKNTSKLLSKEPRMSELSNGKWLKLEVSQTGIYTIEANDIKAMGYDLLPSDVKSLKIFGIGGKPLSESISDDKQNEMNEQEIIVNTNSDGTLKDIMFFGAGPVGFENRNGGIWHYQNYYSSKISYLLTWGGNDGKRAIAEPLPDGEIINHPKNYTERFVFEEDIINPYNPGAGRDWFGRTFFSVPFSPVLLENLDRSGKILYRFALAHHSYNPDAYSANIGTYKIYENNTSIGDLSISPDSEYQAATRKYANIEIPASMISNDNRSIIKLDYSNAKDNSATPYFDYYEIHYPRSLVAINNSINLIPDKEITGITQYSLNGFEGNIFGFDISNPANPMLVKNNATTGGMFVLQTDLKQNQFKNYFISSTILKPLISKTEVANLRDIDVPSEVVIITHPDLIESAVKYMDYRQSQGLKTTIFRTDHIYNEFACGNGDLTAIRDFLSFLKKKWNGKPDYIVLWGDGHYDYRSLSTKKANYLPAYQTYTEDLQYFSEIEHNYASDDFFALLLGNDSYADVRIGRVTIDEPEIGNTVLNKIIDYENNSSVDQWRTGILMIADDGPTSKNGYDGALHTNSSERLQNEVISGYAPDLQIEKIYLVEYQSVNGSGGIKKPQVTENLLTKINSSGALILNWFGHGNPRVWAHEFILERDITIPKMVNYTKPFFLTAATCDYGRFDDPEVRSGAEEMFISKNGGAIGVLSATRVVYASENESLTKDFYRALLTKDSTTGLYPTLGDAMLMIKQKRISSNDRKYFLLGDPLVRIALPDYIIKIDSINGRNVEDLDSAMQLKALSEMTVSGTIYDRLGKAVVADYNGAAVLTLRDGDRMISLTEVVNNISRSQFNFTKMGSALNQSTYNIVNGEFRANFFVPKDISFSELKGKLFTYAYSSDKRFAKGVFNNLRVNGFDNISGINDNEGPEINIFLDSRNFVENEIVSNNPMLIVDLYDKSGINTTGLGIGHRIESWIDGSSISNDLTEKYVSSITDSRRGTVVNMISGLSAGKHKIKIRAWDVFNNFSVNETSFIITGTNGYLDNLLAIPNPFMDNTKISFRHNAELPITVKIDIFTINGVLIRDLESNVNTSYETEVFWDGLDNNNNVVGDGVYIFRVQIPDKSGINIVKFGKLIKVK